jgi:aspartate kinase
MKVVKFGGTSLADGQQLEKVVGIIAADPTRRAVVVSAPGKRFAADTKTTDLLISYADAVATNDDVANIQTLIKERYGAIADHFGVPQADLADIYVEIDSLATETFPDADYRLAAFKAHGEKLNAQLVAKVLTHMGQPARYVDPQEAGIWVTDDPNNALILDHAYPTIAKLQPELDEGILVFPGFYGYTAKGQIATFSRGGSDITGAVIARGLGADAYENFTDVSAIYAVNPHQVANPVGIKQMTYREMRELAYAGFSVFHDEALIPAIQGEIPINVRNTNEPDAPGTWIVPTEQSQPETTITGIASSNRFGSLYLHKYLLNKEIGFTRKILDILFHYDVAYEHIPSGIDDLTIILDKDTLPAGALNKVMRDIEREIQPDKMTWSDDYAIVMVVGEGMVNRVGTTTEIFTPLADNNISLKMINQGSSEISIMFAVSQQDEARAVQLIYNHFWA